MKKCPYCNTLNPDDAEVCENCGKSLKGQMLALVCPNCGKINALGSRECSVCHTKLSQGNHQLVSRKITPRKKISGGGISPSSLLAFQLLYLLI
ncbi:zinc-ribbon domain-containing protein [Limosilactobacillus reuteri]|nr:zinc ribbon domain-containing protein [Limosilactobacillus reuteri]